MVVVVGMGSVCVCLFLFVCFSNGLLPSRSSNCQLQRHERDKQINIRGETPSHTYTEYTELPTNRENGSQTLSIYEHMDTACRLKRRKRTIATAWGAWRITPATVDCLHINMHTSWLSRLRRPSCFLIKGWTNIFVRNPKMSAVSKSVMGSIQTLWSLSAKVSLSKILNVHDCVSRFWQAVPSVASEVASVNQHVNARNSETVTFAIDDQRSVGTQEIKDIKSKRSQVKGIYFW